MAQKTILYIVNVDWFFLSHRKELALSMLDRGYKVYVLAKSTGKKEDIEKMGIRFMEIDFDRSGRNPFKEIKTIFKILNLLIRLKPSIIHNVTIKPALYASIAAKIYSSKELTVVNAISGLGYNFIDDRKGPVQSILRRLMNLAFRNNVRFIFQNPDDLATYRELGYLKSNDSVLIKGAGVDGDEFPFHEPVPKSRLHVVLTARMLKDKGVMEFIKAANLLYEKWNSKVSFRLIGDLDKFNPASLKEHELRNIEIANYLTWEGHKEDVKSILVDSDIVCLPSYREGLPKSLIEAMAIGRPIVSTDVPGCRECVEEGYNGFLVASRDSTALADAIDTLLSNSQLRLEMGKNSRAKMIKELSLDIVISKTIAFYQENS